MIMGTHEHFSYLQHQISYGKNITKQNFAFEEEAMKIFNATSRQNSCYPIERQLLVAKLGLFQRELQELTVEITSVKLQMGMKQLN